MDASTTFLDCPAYLNGDGTVRCGLPAAVEDSYTLGSTDGPVASVKIQCPAGHWFNGPVAALTVHADPTWVTILGSQLPQGADLLVLLFG